MAAKGNIRAYDHGRDTMRAIPAILVAVSVTAVSHDAARACDNDRYLCELKIAKPVPAADARVAPKPVSGAVQAGRKIAPRTAQRASEEKAPPDEPQPAAKFKSASFWQPIDIPSQTVQPLEPKDAAAETRASVRVVAAEELNEIDLAALSVPEPVKIVPIRVVWPEPPAPRPAPQVVTAPPPPAPADTSLLERVMATFGGAFGAASALRMFFG
jgi:hypothetical protein